MFRYIKRIINKYFSKQRVYCGKHNINAVYTFTVKGVDYFTFSDPHNMPYKRALLAGAIINEVNSNMNTDFIKNYFDGFNELLKQEKLSYMDLIQLNKLIDQKRKVGLDIESIYELASIYYFDEYESPFGYDIVYNKAKIKKFKSSKIDDFFFNFATNNLIRVFENLSKGFSGIFKSKQDDRKTDTRTSVTTSIENKWQRIFEGEIQAIDKTGGKFHIQELGYMEYLTLIKYLDEKDIKSIN